MNLTMWTEALRSGRYRQGRIEGDLTIHRFGKTFYSALGVAKAIGFDLTRISRSDVFKINELNCSFEDTANWIEKNVTFHEEPQWKPLSRMHIRREKTVRTYAELEAA